MMGMTAEKFAEIKENSMPDQIREMLNEKAFGSFNLILKPQIDQYN